MRSLVFTFKTSDNKTKTLRLTDYAGDLDASQAQAFMEAVIDANQFNKEGSKQYAQAVSAHAVTTDTVNIWENEL